MLGQVSETSWLHPGVSPAPSAIAGTGLFATHPIAMGDVVMRLGGSIIDDHELEALTPPYSSLCIGVGQHLLIDPAHPVRFGNHSCEPNLWHEDATTLVARRDIMAGEEVTIDYATHTASERWSMPYRCGAPACRGMVTGSDWRNQTLQRLHGRHWTPPLLALIATMSDD